MRRQFDRLRDGLWALLPAPLNRWIPATAIGYVILNAATFSLDVGLMSVCYRLLHLPYPVAVSLGYAAAFVLGYCLNRVLNFESHGAVGGEVVRYALVVAINYAAFVIGFSWSLVHLGVNYQLARVGAACVETVFMYCTLRWFVFAPRGRRAA